MSAIPNSGATNAARTSRSSAKKTSANTEQAASTSRAVNAGPSVTVKRLNLNLSEKTYHRLLYLQENTDALNSTDVVREALRVYDALVSETIQGKKIALIDPNKPDEIEVLRLF